MKNRYTTVAIFVAILIISLGMVFGGWVRFIFFPNVPSDYIIVELKMAEGVPLSETERALDRIESALDQISCKEVSEGKFDPVKHKGVFLGYSPINVTGPGIAAAGHRQQYRIALCGVVEERGARFQCLRNLATLARCHRQNSGRAQTHLSGQCLRPYRPAC